MAPRPKQKLVVEVPARFTARDVHKLLRLAANRPLKGRR